MIQKHFNLFRPGIARDVDDLMQNTQSLPDALQFEAGISDKPNTHARASLYMYMNAAVSFPNAMDLRFSSQYSSVAGLWWTMPL
jgi:hypothetical protein